MHYLLELVIFVIYSLLFWVAMGLGFAMIAIVGMGLWSTLKGFVQGSQRQ